MTTDLPVIQPTSGLDHAQSLTEEARRTLHEVIDASTIRFEDANAGNHSVVFVGWNKWQWGPLPDTAQPKVGSTRRAVERLRTFAHAATASSAPDRVDDLQPGNDFFARIIEQPNGTHPNGAPGRSLDEIKTKLDKALDEYLAAIRMLPSAHGTGERLVVADTSALLDRPDLQQWRLDGEPWTVVLVPQVLSELDERKRDNRTRDAAQKVIRQIEDLDRRGDTLVGVPLAGKLRYREIAITPDMSRTLPWLRADVPDDHIIANALELTWADLTARIAVAASDRNIRNKARLAGLRYVRTSDL